MKIIIKKKKITTLLIILHEGELKINAKWMHCVEMALLGLSSFWFDLLFPIYVSLAG